MKKILPLFLLILCLALPAWAESGKIKVVNEDGSVSEFEIPANEDAMRVEPPPAAPPVVAEPAPSAVLKSPQPVPDKPAKATVKAAEKKPSPKVVKSKIAKPAKPSPPPLPAIAAAWPEDFAPYPARKPAPPKSFVYDAYEAETAGARVEGEPIARNEAVAIAIRNAPPARDFRVRQVMHADRPVYAVIFKTERGESEILVDAFTGDILK